mmetsp:Transcript_43454/g.48686  ORF Transcript_43454/g.48686 Transcript_43454/m.48686 type:complete len:81 (+) Transcript_43454:61-303(+)
MNDLDSGDEEGGKDEASKRKLTTDGTNKADNRQRSETTDASSDNANGTGETEDVKRVLFGSIIERTEQVIPKNIKDIVLD